MCGMYVCGCFIFSARGEHLSNTQTEYLFIEYISSVATCPSCRTARMGYFGLYLEGPLLHRVLLGCCLVFGSCV